MSDYTRETATLGDGTIELGDGTAVSVGDYVTCATVSEPDAPLELVSSFWYEGNLFIVVTRCGEFFIARPSYTRTYDSWEKWRNDLERELTGDNPVQVAETFYERAKRLGVKNEQS
jgi:hypothetical protein